MSPSRFKRIVFLIILFGIILRLSQYLFNRSLWFDEALISLNIINRSYGKLFDALDYNQGAPVGFLLLTKFLVQLLGDSEYVLRLLPLLSSIFSIILFYKFATLYLRDEAVIFALSIFAVSEPLIYYSSEVKQYSTDVLFILIVLILGSYIEKHKLSFKNAAAFIGVGIIAIWFSHPAIFVFFSVAITLICKSIKEKNWTKVNILLICFVFWILGLTSLYFFNLSKLDKSALNHFNKNDFMAIPPTFSWLCSKLQNVIYIMRINYKYLTQILFFVGVVAIFIQKRYLFFMFTLPILIALTASALHLYPYVHRLLLFLVPAYIIFISKGFESIFIRGKPLSIFAIILATLILLNPAVNALRHLKNPRVWQEMRQALQYIKDNEQKGDVIYVFHSSQYQFKYYAKKFGFNDQFVVDKSEHYSDPSTSRIYKKPGYSTLVLGVSSPGNEQKYINQLNKLKGEKRVWVLISRVWNADKRTVIDHLNVIGKQIKVFYPAGGSYAYLYDLSYTSTPKGI